jgi:hypothetical protein
LLLRLVEESLLCHCWWKKSKFASLESHACLIAIFLSAAHAAD